MNCYKYTIGLTVGLALSGAVLCAAPGEVPSGVTKSIHQGVQYLSSQQSTNGAWEPARYPAITAMVLSACRSEASNRDRSRTEFLTKGYRYLLENAKPDGGIYTGTNYQNYNTSWSLTALAQRGSNGDKALIRQARRLIISWQLDLGEPGKRDNPLDGGFGYGDGSPRANMANTLAPLQALHETRSFAASDEPRYNRESLVDFLHRTQNFSGVNHDPWVCEDAENSGGFMYYPGRSFAGEIKMANGQTGYRSYGSMTCAGLLCYFYSGVDRRAPEVRAALDWMQRHFSVDENPGMGEQGLFYYYSVLSKALSVYNVDKLKVEGGKEINWRETLAHKLISLQKPDGNWVSNTNRWMEDSPVLCTAYALNALTTISESH